MRRLVLSAIVLSLILGCLAKPADKSPIDTAPRSPKIQPRLPHVLRLAAFNIKTFGRAKMSDPVRAGRIRDIVRRYDVILIQEIRDSSGESLQLLWDMVDRQEFGMVHSARLGRTSYKEEYAYFYRLSTVSLVSTHQYDDGVDDGTDAFEREPYAIRIRPVGGTYDIALVGIHVKPDHAVKEINDLVDAYYDVLNTWGINDVIIMGDLNADCSYARESDLSPLDIYNPNTFDWVIGFEEDTTVSLNTDCAYDRFIVSGPNVQQAVIPGSEGIFLFDDYFGISNSVAYDLSDHYPVELELY